MDQARINGYIEIVSERIKFHSIQARHALAWHQFFSVLGVVLTSSQAFLMLLLSINGVDGVGVGIAGGAFAAILAITSRIQTIYYFNTLSVMHSNLEDDYVELLEVLNGGPDETLFNHCIARYVAITERSHIIELCACNCQCFGSD